MTPKVLLALAAAAHLTLVKRLGGGPMVVSPSHEFDRVTSS
jgi:hypothetical protein